MYTLSRNLHITIGITFFIAFIMKFSCPLFAAYSLNDIVPHIDADEVIKTLHELNSYQAFNKHFPNSSPAVEKIERELVEKVSKGTWSLPAVFAQMCDLIKQKEIEKPQCTALIRVYQAAILQQARNDPIKKSDVDQIISFMKTGADVTKIDKEDKNALHRAAENGCGAAVQFLVPLFAKNGLLNMPTVDEQTALHMASECGNIECIKTLLDAGTNLTATDKYGYNALHAAARRGNVAAVQLLAPLFAKNGLLDAQHNMGRTALHYAAESGNIECIKILLDTGAKFTATDKNGYNALHRAAENGRRAAIQFLTPLFAKNGMLDSPGFLRRTALHFAAYSGDIKCIKVLCDAGAKLTTTDRNGQNALHISAEKGRGAAVQFLIPLFVKNGLLDTPSGNGQTALVCAYRQRHVRIVALLWILGAKSPLSKEELPDALQRARAIIQNLPPNEFDGLIAALGTLHEMNIKVPTSLTPPFSSAQELFLPLREAILERLRPIQQKIRHGLPSPSLLPEIENIIEEYLIGKVPPPQPWSSNSSSSSSSSSSSLANSYQLQ